MSCDEIGRTIFGNTDDGRWLFPLLGERVRVRASHTTISANVNILCVSAM